MTDGFIKAGAATVHVKVADPEYNTDRIIEQVKLMDSEGVRLMVFPELSISGYTCGDLFLHEKLTEGCKEQLLRLAKETEEINALIFAGLPMIYEDKLYNCAAAVFKGEVLGIIPKTFLPNYSEFYEARHFTQGFKDIKFIELDGRRVPFGTNLIFESGDVKGGLKVAAEICEDLWAPETPSAAHVLNGANVIVNLSASDALIGKAEYRRKLLEVTSARLSCAYIYAGAGASESTQDLVFAGHDIIAENGSILKESGQFKDGVITADIDLGRLLSDRQKTNTFRNERKEEYLRICFKLDVKETVISRSFPRNPFVPPKDDELAARCEEIIDIQSAGLKKRLEHTGVKSAVVGLSGGLDSTLALLVTHRAFIESGLAVDGIKAVTMPCFGTTDRTYDNACSLAKELKVSLRTVDIKKAVRQHLKDIGQDEENRDITYENAQARERTQVLMDIANMENGLVIGTGDMSELALGWATYNGDHMSMYGVNAGVPKTLVRYLVSFFAEKAEKKGNSALSAVLKDIVDTPVSPELLPAVDGRISQKTEELVGPYELHDFFLYYVLRFGFSPKKIFRMALMTFSADYGRPEIKKWLGVFFRRFFTQQFKRSCLPDGPKVGTAALSPRGDLRMPSDASCALWLKEIEEL